MILFSFFLSLACSEHKEFYHNSEFSNSPVSKSRFIKDTIPNTPSSGVEGNYNNQNYVNPRKIPGNSLTYEANGGSRQNYPLSNAFDDKSNTYWMSNTPNSASFTNTLTVNFNSLVTLEALLCDTAYTTNKTANPQTRTYWGYPTTMKVYASTIDDQYRLVATFTGSHQYPTERVQFVFPKPISCKQLRFDFIDVTEQTMTEPHGQYPFIGNFIFLKYIPVIQTGSPSGNYAKDSYVSENKIPTDQFTPIANGGDMTDHPLSYAFDGNKDTYWVSNTVNSNSFVNTITINFQETLSLEAFLYDTAYSTDKTVTPNTRAFWGYPTTLNVYASVDNNNFELAASFVGTPVFPMTRIQFVFPTPIKCSKIRLDFHDVTPQRFVGETAQPAIGELILIKHDDRIPIAGASGKYDKSDYINARRISQESFTKVNNGGENSNYPFTNAFDGNKDKYWVSGKANSDNFINTITVNFVEMTTLEAMRYFPAYFSSNTEGRRYEGFPTTLKVYTAQQTNSDNFELVATFHGTPKNPMSWIQFVFPQPIICKKLRLDFVEVMQVQHNMFVQTPGNYPIIGELTFLKYIEPMAFEGVRGVYADQSYVSSRMIPSSSFTATCNGGERSGFEFSKAFDSNKDSYWISNDANTDTFKNTVTIDFKKLISLEAFLIDTAFSTNHATLVRTFCGFPTILNLYISTDGVDFTQIAQFSGEPVYPMARIQYVLPKSISCTKLKLEFEDLTVDTIKTKQKTTYIGGIYFIRSGFRPTSPPTAEISAGDFTFGENNCNNPNDHCDITITEEKYVNIIIEKTEFNDYISEENGGAIYLVNTGVSCEGRENEKIKFTNCASNGGGGAIFIRNEFDVDKVNYTINVKNVKFDGCSAIFGSAIYVYSNSVPCDIYQCLFENCKLNESNSDSPFVGGSAIFMTIRNGYPKSLTINGGDSPLVKIYDNFNAKAPSVLSSEQEVVFERCTFVNQENSKGSIFFVGGNHGSNYYLKNCIFKGKLEDGYHYIDGNTIAENPPKLIVKSCKFEADEKMAINNVNNEFLVVDLKNQNFNVDFATLKNSNDFASVISALAILIVAAIAAAILIILKKNGNAVVDENEETNEIDNNFSINKQLI